MMFLRAWAAFLGNLAKCRLALWELYAALACLHDMDRCGLVLARGGGGAAGRTGFCPPPGRLRARSGRI